MVDEIINTEEIVIKPLGNHFLGLNWFSGATIMGDGEAVLILDIPGIARDLELGGQFIALEDRLAKVGDDMEEELLDDCFFNI